jgi:membrane protease YdiL (CAAX protease family)
MSERILSLTKLVYAMLAVYAIEVLASHAGLIFLAQTGNVRFAAYTYPAIAILTLVILAGTAIAFKKEGFEQFWKGTSRPAGKDAVLGLIVGIGFLIMAVLLGGNEPSPNLEGYAAMRAMSLSGVFLAITVFLALPILAEIVFRGIAFGTLLGYISTPAAMLISGILFYLLWPLFNPIVRILFGLAMPILYYRTKSLVPTIIANCVLTCSGFAFFLIRLYPPAK